MQIKVFTIPLSGGEMLYEEMNVFLRSKKVLQVENHIVSEGNNSFWTFCIKFADDNSGNTINRDKTRIDYAQVLDGESFKRFAKMREARKQIAKEDALAAYLIFLDEELAGMAKLEAVTLANMKSVKGIGDKKAEKYGQRLLDLISDEKS